MITYFNLLFPISKEGRKVDNDVSIRSHNPEMFSFLTKINISKCLSQVDVQSIVTTI